jgi:hypothetical protein
MSMIWQVRPGGEYPVLPGRGVVSHSPPGSNTTTGVDVPVVT